MFNNNFTTKGLQSDSFDICTKKLKTEEFVEKKMSEKSNKTFLKFDEKRENWIHQSSEKLNTLQMNMNDLIKQISEATIQLITLQDIPSCHSKINLTSPNWSNDEKNEVKIESIHKFVTQFIDLFQINSDNFFSIIQKMHFHNDQLTSINPAVEKLKISPFSNTNYQQLTLDEYIMAQPETSQKHDLVHITNHLMDNENVENLIKTSGLATSLEKKLIFSEVLDKNSDLEKKMSENELSDKKLDNNKNENDQKMTDFEYFCELSKEYIVLRSSFLETLSNPFDFKLSKKLDLKRLCDYYKERLKPIDIESEHDPTLTENDQDFEIKFSDFESRKEEISDLLKNSSNPLKILTKNVSNANLKPILKITVLEQKIIEKLKSTEKDIQALFSQHFITNQAKNESFDEMNSEKNKVIQEQTIKSGSLNFFDNQFQTIDGENLLSFLKNTTKEEVWQKKNNNSEKLLQSPNKTKNLIEDISKEMKFYQSIEKSFSKNLLYEQIDNKIQQNSTKHEEIIIMKKDKIIIQTFSFLQSKKNHVKLNEYSFLLFKTDKTDLKNNQISSFLKKQLNFFPCYQFSSKSNHIILASMNSNKRASVAKTNDYSEKTRETYNNQHNSFSQNSNQEKQSHLEECCSKKNAIITKCQEFFAKTDETIKNNQISIFEDSNPFFLTLNQRGSNMNESNNKIIDSQSSHNCKTIKTSLKVESKKTFSSKTRNRKSIKSDFSSKSMEISRKGQQNLDDLKTDFINLAFSDFEVKEELLKTKNLYQQSLVAISFLKLQLEIKNK